MNYRHIYHAGNFADVVKHCVLIAIIDALKQKPKPFTVLDTHGGIGLYDLTSEQTQKKQEYQHGIAKLLEYPEKTPEVIEQYLSIIQQYNYGELLDYPGSPLISLASIREIDQYIVSELHQEDIKTLKHHLKNYPNATVHHINGYHAIKAFLPPKTGRGLVLIDPAFENPIEYRDIIEHVNIALHRWQNGIITIWYPIKETLLIKQFHERLMALNRPLHIIECSLKNITRDTALNQFGLAIINAPWKLPELLSETLLPYLDKALDCQSMIRTG